jgi:hypothetical protein
VTDTRGPADRVESATIRAWARDNGWPDLKDRGAIPAAVRDAFEADHGGALEGAGDDDDDGVSVMDESGLDDDTGFSGGEPVPHTAGPAGELPPPPASLDEARERVGRDPEAAHLVQRRGRSARGKPRQDKPAEQAPVKVTRAVRDDITGKLAFWLSIPAEPWMRVDPYCGGAYADQIDQIALKAAPLICQSPDLVRWFSKSSTFIMWTELGIACRPVVEAVIAHHVTKRIALDSEGNAHEQQGGGIDFSAYSSSRQPSAAAA